MAKTRASKTSTKTPKPESVPEPEIKSLPPADSNAPKLFILPEGASAEARIITLDDPETSQPNRYYYCPEKGLYEFVRVAAPKRGPRSWLLASQPNLPTANSQHNATDTKSPTLSDGSDEISRGYASKSADLFVATPLDPIFALLPVISPASTPSKTSRKQMFLTLDDHVDTATTVPTHLKVLLRIPQCRIEFENRLRAVCDTVDAGEDSMFRLSLEKLGEELLSKATRMVEKGLPASMEERFVARALQAPVILVKREETRVVDEATGTVLAIDSQSTSGPSESSQTASESQSSVATNITTVSSTTETTVVEDVPNSIATPKAVPHLLRIRTALTFMLRSYISSTLHSGILGAITNSNSIDFAPLETHLKHLEKLRAEANALRIISDNISRKRPVDDDEAIEARAEKKRKKEEEEKRKKAEPRGIKGLRKVDTSGMQKLSSFFTKAPPKKEMKS
jgi:hypothetical protein